MSLDVSGLVAYVNEQSTDLLTATQIKSKTARFATKQTGVLSSAALQLVDTDMVLQDGAGCGYNASGSTPITQRALVTGAVKVQEDLCHRDLQAKWTQIMLNGGQNDLEAQSVETTYMNLKVEKLQGNLEGFDWTGTVAANFYDGIATELAKAGTTALVVNGNPSAVAGGLTSANIYAAVLEFIQSVPAAVKRHGDYRIFLGEDYFEILSTTLLEKNNFHYSTGGGEVGAEDYSLVFPGTRIRIEGVAGLDGSAAIYGMRTAHLFMGCDMESDADQMKVWYSDDDDVMKHSIRFRRGWQVAFPSEVTRGIYT